MVGRDSVSGETIEDLTSRINSNTDSGEVVTTDLSTSQRIIARVTDGIYREPWAAFRELIANAYDADATRVILETGAPDFSQVIIRDNGNGMTRETVAYVVKSIGGSSKRTVTGQTYNTVSSDSSDMSPGGRPLIGKIGIGLFAVAQLTQHFQIITKAAGDSFRTSATIELRTHDEERTSEDDGSDFVAGEVSITSETVHESDKDTHGTTIVLYELKPEIRRSLQSNRRWRLSETIGPDSQAVRAAPTYHIGALPKQIPGYIDGIEPNFPWSQNDSPTEKFKALVQAAADISGRSKAPALLEHFDDYMKLIWQLSLAMPLDYIDGHPFDSVDANGMMFLEAPAGARTATFIELEGQSLRSKLGLSSGNESKRLPFKVFVDGVELKRPITCPSELRRASRIKAPMMLAGKVTSAFKDAELERAGGQLSFEAYLYWNSQIVPKETQGVLIRVREASGTLFDRSFLDYQTSEQNRLSQISAEIFVKQGLDSAINIDRESFNYSHPHFLYIQKWLHRAIRLMINRNKGLGKEDLDAERKVQKVIVDRGIVTSAVKVWETKRGEESDPPIVFSKTEAATELAEEIGGIEVDWAASGSNFHAAKSSAIAIVLEAYGVLGQLDMNERAKLIRDILSVLEED